MASRIGLFGCGCLFLLIIVGIGGFLLGSRYGQNLKNRIFTDVHNVKTAATTQAVKIENNIKNAEQAVDSLANDGTSTSNKKNSKKSGEKSKSTGHHGGPANLDVDFKI